MKVRLIQLDGELPNLALMKLAHWHKAQGDDVYLTRHIYPQLFESQDYDKVYASSIFRFSEERIKMCLQQWPDVVLGGTGTLSTATVEDLTGEYEHYDYSGYPEFDASIGFTQRGCRLKCKFCVVPTKEGKPRSVNSIYDIWRGGGHPKKLHILDNDFFGQEPEKWAMRINEIATGKFKVCLSQGINVRMLNRAACVALKSIDYRDTKFKEKRLYTAWDNLRDEKVFFVGVDTLEQCGVPPTHLRAYMLIGFDILETWDRIWYRFKRMVERGIEPYPMVYDRSRTDLLCFQRWVIRGMYRFCPWPEYERETKTAESVQAWERVYAA